MPGLLNQSTWEPLLLKSSCVKACANGYSLGLSAHLTYANPEDEPVEGVFVYLLEESEVVVGFESVTSGRSVSFQIRHRARVEDCCFDCCNHSTPALQCSNGHLILDDDTERTTFIISIGVIGPLEIVTIIFSTTLELRTQVNGAIRLVLPSIFTPIVTNMECKNEAGSLCDDSSTSCFGAGGLKAEKPLSPDHPRVPDIFTEQAFNLHPYEFNFEMLVKGPCLLAGLESPTHALRADADPGAKSASSIYITLAEGHQYDRNVEILLHPSEPHVPHVVLEEGRMTFDEYEQYIKNRRDFIRAAKKDGDADKKVGFVQKRFHKDIFYNPVLMLNFCPDLCSTPTDVGNVTREFIFLIDRNGSMSGIHIEKIKEAMMVAVKSLPSGSLLNITGFGSNAKTLFSVSRLINDATLALACEYIQKMRVDMGGTNIYGALSWIFQQPVLRGYPRQIFILTDAALSNAGKIIELVRKHASTARCFSFGLGPNACRRLLRGVAKVTGGRVEFFSEGERLQPKLIKSLKKAIEPAVSDVRIDWYVPDSVEALLSPSEIATFYPGDRLISFCTIYNVSAFLGKKSGGKHRSYKNLSRSSISSIFQSQEETSTPPTLESGRPPPIGERNDIEEALMEITKEISLEFSCGKAEETEKVDETERSLDLRQRICQPSYIQEQYMLTRCSVSSEREQGLSHRSTSSESTGSREIAMETSSLPQGLESVSQQEQKSILHWDSTLKLPPLSQIEAGCSKSTVALGSEEIRKKQKALARAALSGRSFSSPQGELDMHHLRKALEKVSHGENQSRKQSLASKLEDQESQQTPRSVLASRSLADSNSVLFSACPLDWDTFTDPQYLFTAAPSEEAGDATGNAPPMTHCRLVIHGLVSGKAVSWEVTANLASLFHQDGVENGQMAHGDGWEDLLHHLTARSVIQDFENMAEKESERDHGFSRRYRLKAIQTSKACNTVSMYTATVPIDANTQESLPASLEVRNPGVKFSQCHSSRPGSRRQRSYSVGLGRQHNSDDLDDAFLSTEREDTPASPSSMSSSSGWEKQSILDGNVYNPSSSGSQKSVEYFFGSRFSLGRRRTYSSPGRSLPLKPQCLSAETEASQDSETCDYLPLVRLQLASGAFLLTEVYSQAVQIPLNRLKRASPFTRHRTSLSPPSRCTSPRGQGVRAEASNKSGQDEASHGGVKWGRTVSAPARELSAQRSTEILARAPRRTPCSHHESISEAGNDFPPLCRLHQSCSVNGDVLNSGQHQVDSGRGSETDLCDNSPVNSEASLSFYEPAAELQRAQEEEDDLEGSSWATAVALAWLEHQCAGFFVEWELVAAKADAWLCTRHLPEGLDVAGLKGAARQLFLLLRHWDENIKLNMLCYNPNNV
ncbi:von Willebrand factor A domain-containing protein 5B2 [Latimeria chalumnae]|uniref:von Willebrand factor A domain-containing protein 5B2 n=1 Tax=Latimeria chalumnae TaxID=7897 RepID=UPI0003C17F7D|nr:PREDICTED: von Willebrand factor A domain-containing protein 5B2 [Latimeria chalumnae]|eukprot:XP_005996809.1 PREDICTED: von Willebrand factor A domain-containing protein 5B2 [Latimeria chalumnae]